MKKLLLFSFLALFFIKAYSQVGPIEKEKLATLLHKRINDHREDKGHSSLSRNEDLSLAATIQSNYLLKAKKLKHSNPDPKFINTMLRVQHYNTSFEVVGENILVSKTLRFPLSNSGWAKIAYDMFNSWKSSKVHYKNMMSDNYTHGDFAFSYDTKSKRIYAVQVFGKMGVKIAGQLSENAFGIQKKDRYCNTLLQGERNTITNMGNSITIESGEVVFRYHNVKNIEDVLNHKLDGLAIDLVERNQMLCGQDNKLDASGIYDGILLKPILRDEILANNRAQNPNRLVVSLGIVPKSLKGKELSPNLIVIKLGMQCSYVTPATVDTQRYALRPVEPEIFNPKIDLITEGIGQIEEVFFEFDTGKVVSKKMTPLNTNTKKILALDIKSYTSLDGSFQSNQNLHQQRAKHISKVLDDKLNLNDSEINIDSKENWELLDYQLELFGEEDIRQLDKEKIRLFINQQKSLEWKRALEEQRKSKATIYYADNWKITDSQHLYYNLINGLVSKDFNQANKALFEIYKDSTNSYFLGEEFIIDRMFDQKELVQNVSAILLRDIYGYSLDNVVYFVRTWLSRADELSVGAQKNLLNLYTITGRRMLQSWEVSSESLSKVMHPDKVNPFFDNYKSEDTVNPLFLNFHMTRIEYFGQINQQQEISESFNFITDYFREQALTVEDDVDLSLFFNSWSMYHLTVEQLRDRLWDDHLNKRGAFVLAQTLTAYPYNNNGLELEESQLLDAHRKAITFDKSAWCYWINREFQNLRRAGVKNLYCKTCNQ